MAEIKSRRTIRAIRHFHGEKRSNETHESTTDPDARLARKSGGHEAKLAYCGNVMIENRNGLVVDTELLQCNLILLRDEAGIGVHQRFVPNEILVDPGQPRPAQRWNII